MKLLSLEERIDILQQLGNYLKEKDERLGAYIHRTHFNNKWFTPENQWLSIDAITENFLNENKLNQWAKNYYLDKNNSPKKIGLIPAANIPLVAFHDIISIFITGNISVIKLSERDQFILPFFVKKMTEWNSNIEFYFQFPKQLSIKELDGIIATGSNNSSRYFESYFAKIPNIIRKNRNSIGIIQGDETADDFRKLGKDIFQYYGLGCRNVSKIHVPKNYKFEPLLEILHEFNSIILHEKYKNNFDYQITLLILNNAFHLNNGSIIISKNKAIQSPISVLHFEEYDNIDSLEKELNNQREEIQCIVSKIQFESMNTIHFGQAQSPTLLDYADGVDTIYFLLQLNNS